MNVIQIPGDPDPPTSFFLSVVSLIRVLRFYELLWRGDWFFSFRTRNTSGSAKPTNHKLETRYIRTHFALDVSSRSLTLSLDTFVFCILQLHAAAKEGDGGRKRGGGEDRRRIRKKKKKNSKKRSVFFSSFVMNIFMNRRTFYITHWLVYTLLVRKRKTNANVVMLRHVKGEDLDVR